MRFVVGLAALPFLGSIALAQPVPPGSEGALADLVAPEPGRRICFERRYDADHLRAHPAQKVTAIGFRLAYYRHAPDKSGPPGGQRNYYFQLTARMKGERKTLNGLGECSASARGIRCGIECDGGGIVVERRDARTIVIRFDEGKRIRMSRSCDDEGDTLDLTPGADDRSFRLTQTTSCPAYDRW